EPRRGGDQTPRAIAQPVHCYHGAPSPRYRRKWRARIGRWIRTRAKVEPADAGRTTMKLPVRLALRPRRLVFRPILRRRWLLALAEELFQLAKDDLGARDFARFLGHHRLVGRLLSFRPLVQPLDV